MQGEYIYTDNAIFQKKWIINTAFIWQFTFFFLMQSQARFQKTHFTAIVMPGEKKSG